MSLSNTISESRRREFLQHLIAAAIERTHHVVRYDPAYVRTSYPGGDVPADTGVCTDEIIRSYRSVGVDLQKEVHEDIGVVVDQKSAKSGRYMIIHNIGQGPRMEDIMFNWKVTGHYRYFGPAL